MKNRKVIWILLKFEKESDDNMMEEGLVHDRIMLNLPIIVTIEDSEIIRAAIGIKNVDFHGTLFDRSPSGNLLVTFRLQTTLTRDR